jgi:hypothetical protein
MLSRRLIVSTLLAGAFALNAATTTADSFAGKWQLDKKKTQATGAPDDLQLEMKQDGDGWIIKSKYREPKTAMYPLLWVGIMTYELPLKPTETTTQIGPFTHVSKTTVDGNKMTTDWKAAMEKGGVEGQWIRTLSNDGREMTRQIISKASDGRNMDQTLVFKRK